MEERQEGRKEEKRVIRISTQHAFLDLCSDWPIFSRQSLACSSQTSAQVKCGNGNCARGPLLARDAFRSGVARSCTQKN